MAGLQRSALTFRRSGSSGLVWDERFLTEGAEEEDKPKPDDNGGGGGARRQPELRYSRSLGSVRMLRRRGRGDAGDADDKKRKPKAQNNQEDRAPGMKAFRTRDVAPAAEPPSPRVPGCVLCAILRGSVAQWRGSSAAQRAAKRPSKR